MTTPIISIAIPTYNRADILRETLQKLEQQSLFATEHIEVVISDNASPDGTALVANEFIERHPGNCRYVRNEINQGIDGNILRVAHEARGDFVLLMSDDDILLPHALEKLVKLVGENPHLTFAFLNALPFTGDYAPDKLRAPVLAEKQNGFVASPDELIEKIWIWATFISSFFFKRSAWLEVPNHQSFVGSEIYLTHILYRMIARAPAQSLYIHGEPLVAARMEYTGSFKIMKAFGESFMSLLCVEAPRLGFSRRSIAHVKRKVIMRGLPPMIMMIRAGKTPRYLNRTELRQLASETWHEPVAWLTLWPLALLPVGLLSFLRNIKRWANV